jgi:hypothetical protein
VRKVFLSVLLICSGFAVGCGSTTFKDTAFTPSIPPVTTPTGANVLKIDVNGGPEVGVAGGGVYQNVPFATAEICAPGSTSKLRDDQRTSGGDRCHRIARFRQRNVRETGAENRPPFSPERFHEFRVKEVAGFLRAEHLLRMNLRTLDSCLEVASKQFSVRRRLTAFADRWRC